MFLRQHFYYVFRSLPYTLVRHQRVAIFCVSHYFSKLPDMACYLYVGLLEYIQIPGAHDV